MLTHIGIIGGGNISGTHAQAIQSVEGAKIAAIYGQNEEKITRLSKRYGGAVYTEISSFLKHRPLDMVIIGSPSGLHAEQGIAAAKHGLHVLVEKPIDITVERADALIEECSRANVKLGVCFQDRVAPDICTAKHMIDAGELGRPLLASARVKWYRPPEYYSDSRWRGTQEFDGGGALMNQGIHTADLLLWLFGSVRRVQAKAVTALHEVSVEDTVVAILEFENGAIGTLEATTAAYPGYSRRVELSGSEGTIILEQSRLVSVDLRKPRKSFTRAHTVDNTTSANSPIVADIEGHKRILEDFMLAIRSGGSPRCDGREGRRSVALVQAIYQASREGGSVVLSH